MNDIRFLLDVEQIHQTFCSFQHLATLGSLNQAHITFRDLFHRLHDLRSAQPTCPRHLRGYFTGLASSYCAHSPAKTPVFRF